MKNIKLLCTSLILGILFITPLASQTYDLGFSTAFSNGEYCVTVQMKSDGPAFNLGGLSYVFSYNDEALLLASDQSLNFDESTVCSGQNNLFNPQNPFIANGQVSSGVAPTIFTGFASCPEIANTWIDIAEFCFLITDNTATSNLQWSSNPSQFPATTSQNLLEDITLGTLTDLDEPLGSDNGDGGTDGASPIYDLGFSTAFVNDQYCVTTQIKSDGPAFTLGGLSYVFSYNDQALSPASNQSLNFDETTTCSGQGNLFNPQTPFLNEDFVSAGVAPSVFTGFVSCPEISNSWIDIAEFCFLITDDTATSNLQWFSDPINHIATTSQDLLGSITTGTLTDLDEPLNGLPFSTEFSVEFVSSECDFITGEAEVTFLVIGEPDVAYIVSGSGSIAVSVMGGTEFTATYTNDDSVNIVLEDPNGFFSLPLNFSPEVCEPLSDCDFPSGGQMLSACTCGFPVILQAESNPCALPINERRRYLLVDTPLSLVADDPDDNTIVDRDTNGLNLSGNTGDYNIYRINYLISDEASIFPFLGIGDNINDLIALGTMTAPGVWVSNAPGLHFRLKISDPATVNDPSCQCDDVTDGPDGTDGTDGGDGTDGNDGADGTDGTNGTNGTDGTDGANDDGSDPNAIDGDVCDFVYFVDVIVNNESDIQELTYDLTFVLSGAPNQVYETDGLLITANDEGIAVFSILGLDCLNYEIYTESITAIGSDCPTMAIGGFFVSCFTTAVELLQFEAEVLREGNLLRWTTGTEVENDYFTVERSLNGTEEWRPIKVVDGAGNSSVAIDYVLLDAEAPKGRSCYRLKDTEFSGLTSIASEVICVERLSAEFEFINAYPIPTTDLVFISFNANERGRADIRVLDIAGKEVYSKGIQMEYGVNELELDLSNLANGTYFFTLSTESKTINTKLLKD